MAEARIAVAEPRVNTVEEITSPQTWRDVFFSFRSSAAKRYYKARYVITFCAFSFLLLLINMHSI